MMRDAADHKTLVGAPRQTFRSLARRRFLRHRLALVGAVIVAAIVLMAVFAPWLAPHDPNHVNIMLAREGPSPVHFLGSDLVLAGVCLGSLFPSSRRNPENRQKERPAETGLKAPCSPC